jgi:hypothetical protein
VATLASTILPALDAIRGIGGILGLRPFTVTLRVRTWSGAKIGFGAKTDTNTVLTNVTATSAGTLENIKCRFLTTREIVASGGLYRDRDIRIGRITPSFAAAYGLPAGGFGDSTLDPTPGATPTEIFWNVAGPGMPSNGAWCSRIAEEVSALHYSLILRADAKAP